MADKVTFEGAPFHDYDGDFVALGSDGQLYYVDEGVYAAELQQALAREEWYAEGDQDGQLLEHRLGRQLTAAERHTIAEDMVRGGHADAISAYQTNYSDDRTRDDHDRQELMREYAEEAFDAAPAEEPTEEAKLDPGKTSDEQMAEIMDKPGEPE